MKKLVCILIVLMILCMGVSAYAEEAAPDTAITTEAVTTAPITEADAANEDSNTNPGVWLWNLAMRYRVEIISGITLALSTLVAIIFKKKIKPTLEEWCKNATEFILGAEKNRTEGDKQNQEVIKEYREEMDRMRREHQEENAQNAKIVTDVLLTVKALTEEVIQNGKVNEVVLQCLNDQEDTLNTIVQSSTMAQWKKDIEGQRHAAHTAAIADMLSAKDKPNETNEAEEGGEST